MTSRSAPGQTSVTKKVHDPARPARVGFAVAVAFILFLAGWGFLAPVSGAAIAEGSLQVRSQRQSVQHPDGGVVAQLNVTEGQAVRKGDVLLRLADHEPRAKLDVLKAERASLLAQEARLIAERDGKTEPAFSSQLTAAGDQPSVAQAMLNERAVMAARALQFRTQAHMLQARIGQLQEQIAGGNAQIDGLERQQALLEEEAKGARQLLASGYTPKNRVLALERTAAQFEADKGARQAEVASAQQAIGEAELNIARLERERISEITGELRQTQATLAGLGPRIEAAADVLSRTVVAAPASGNVVGLAVFTEGGVVRPGAKLLDIVPADEPLIVDARLQLTDVSEIKQARSADVRLTSIPRNERPQIRGEILTVSADKLTDERSGEGFYAVRVKLNADDVKASKVPLQAGMPTEVIVTTRPRTLLAYLLGPLTDEITGAFREK